MGILPDEERTRTEELGILEVGYPTYPTLKPMARLSPKYYGISLPYNPSKLLGLQTAFNILAEVID